MSKLKKVDAYIGEMWPLYAKKLSDIFDKQRDKLEQLFTAEAFAHAREKETFLWLLKEDIKDVFLTSLIRLDPFTLNQADYIIAAYLYFRSDATEREIAGEPDSLYPRMSRITLRKWIEEAVKPIENTKRSLYR